VVVVVVLVVVKVKRTCPCRTGARSIWWRMDAAQAAA
jgi:hypothetical protein